MKKYILLAIFLLVSGLLTFSVFAKSDNQQNNGQKQNNELKQVDQLIEKLENFTLPDVESTKTNPSSLFIGPQGQFRIISGELTSVGSSTPAIDGVKVWGVSLNVNVTNAKFSSTGTTASSLKVGDKVNIKGTVDSAGTITASIVHLVSAPQQSTSEMQARIIELIKKIRELQQKFGLPLTPLP